MNMNQIILEMLVKEQQQRLLEGARLSAYYRLAKENLRKSPERATPGMAGKIAMRAAAWMISLGERIKTRYEPAVQ